MDKDNSTIVESFDKSSVVQEIDFDFSTEYVLKNTEFLPEQNYENYIRNNPNRRKITIINQSADVMLADSECLPAIEEGEKDGTPINAETMEAFHKVISQADANAKSSFNMTNEVANKVAKYLEQSNQNVKKLEEQIVCKLGTKVQIGGDFVASFDADTKLDVTTFNNKEIIANVSYDSTTDTFNF